MGRGGRRSWQPALALFEKQKDCASTGDCRGPTGRCGRCCWRGLLPRPLNGRGDDFRKSIRALAAARRALELADETARTQFPVERDYVRAHWLLGAAQRAGGDLDEAERHLTEALTRCRGINVVDAEADILLDLARLRAAQGDRDEAPRLAEEALTITERSGYVLQGADVHLFLAELELEQGDREKALAHAQEARRLATCDGPPDYTYKVAYDEAGALLARLGTTEGAESTDNTEGGRR